MDNIKAYKVKWPWNKILKYQFYFKVMYCLLNKKFYHDVSFNEDGSFKKSNVVVDIL